MALPLSLHHDEEHSVLFLSDSDDDDLLPPPRSAARVKPQDSIGAEAMRQKTKDAAANVPLHPIPAMQPAFTESLVEATNNTAEMKPKLRFGDAKHRRNYLLEGAKTDKLHIDLWRYRPGQKHHELWKLLAQISFGVYLLLNGIANSNEQVVSILQSHIDEVDEFLETTLEDIKLAVEDVKDRIDCLKLPMENINTFEQMLEDRNFRLQIVNGNEKIEHIISRTTMALEATFKDVDEGLKATKEFAVYLGDQQERAWRQQRPELTDIFDAMKGNAQGWYTAFMDLQENASKLDTLLTRLGQIVAEMDQRAGEVSRRTRFSVAPFSEPSDSTHQKGNPLSLSPQPQSTRKSGPWSSRSQSLSPLLSSSPTRAIIHELPDEPAGGVVHELPHEPAKARFINAKGNRTRETVIRVEEDIKPAEPQKPADDEGFYILQPRTYTPQPPEPVPSPLIRDPPAPKQEEQPKRTSLRQRVSLKGGNLPEVILVPPRNAPELQASSYQSPRHYQGPDSAYGSDVEVRPTVHSNVEPIPEIAPPRFPNTIPSPRSEHQYFYPVRASPHSPLQRPWTAGTPRPHTAHTANLRNQRSAMGMSTLSNVTTLNPENKQLKKKRSAFGWLKKAFTLDEDERAQFEMRRQLQAPNPYYEGRNQKFLDGKRITEYRGNQ
ncbi:hypothetical protein F5X99DRAFT_252480 [Biscogniauxia marginata]|nr:hypothetical protein F5X99DRAFT_252480 [Biscogniauxia marginata]